MKTKAVIGLVAMVWIGALGLTLGWAGAFPEGTKNGIDWENEVIFATASAGVDMSRMSSIGQAEQEARTQAYDMACVQLNKIINGLKINSQRIYEQSATTDNILKTQTEGMIYNARVWEEEIKWVKLNGQDQPKATLTVVVDLSAKKVHQGDQIHTVYGLAKPIVEYEARLAKTDPQLPRFAHKVVPNTQAYTGLIIDARDTDLDPTCNPKILTSNGEKELYGVRSVDSVHQGERFLAHYTDSVEKARKSSRSGANPLVVKATSIKDARKGDVVVSEEDAKIILTADIDSRFLSKSNVVIVVNSARL